MIYPGITCSDTSSVIARTAVDDWSSNSRYKAFDPGHFLSLRTDGTDVSSDITVRPVTDASCLTNRASTDYTNYRSPMLTTRRFKSRSGSAKRKSSSTSPQWTPQIQTALLLQHWHNADAEYFENKCRAVRFI